MKLLTGKVAIVTGAARGIGAAIALKLAEQGANVAFTYVSDSSAEKANSLVAEIEKLGVKAKAYKANAGDFAACEAFVNDVVTTFGTVDICVNNAGISKDNLLLRMTPEQWDEVMETNLKSVFNVIKACQRPMLKQRSGSIINMTSIVGVKGNAGQANYAASKAGIIGFTKSIAQELGSRNIRCNAIAPGFIETEMTDVLNEETVKMWREQIPMKRGGTPIDIANACIFLASEMSTYITGQTLHVNGGLLTI